MDGDLFYFLNSPYYTPAVCALAVYNPGSKSSSAFICADKKNKEIHLSLYPVNLQCSVQLPGWNRKPHLTSKYSCISAVGLENQRNIRHEDAPSKFAQSAVQIDASTFLTACRRSLVVSLCT